VLRGKKGKFFITARKLNGCWRNDENGGRGKPKAATARQEKQRERKGKEEEKGKGN